MNDLTANMRAVARELLEQGEVKYVIGWEKGTFWFQSPPVFIDKPGEAERLVWDEFCLANLAHYLLEDRYGEGRVGLFVKGCDARGINRLIQDRQIKRERVYLVGIPCPGLKDPEAAMAVDEAGRAEIPLAGRCRNCRHHNPVIFDRLLADPVADAAAATAELAAFTEVAGQAAREAGERYGTWEGYFRKCLRCFACRNVCPACNCTVCCFDLPRVGWLGKQVDVSQNAFYQLTMIMHVAGRCIECGECEQVCPMGIPIMELNRKVIGDIDGLFGPYEAGLDLEAMPPLGFYKVDDPDKLY